MYKLTLEISPKTSIYIAEYSCSTDFDGISARDFRGCPIIPASTIKGALRETMDRLLTALEPTRTCRHENPQKMCGTCLSCKLFGSHMQESTLIFSDAQLQKFSNTWQINYETRSHVAVNRTTRTFKDGSSRTQQVVGNGDDFHFMAEILSWRKLQEDEDKILRVVLQHTKNMGGHKSQGLNFVDISFGTWEEKKTPYVQDIVLNTSRVTIQVLPLSTWNLGKQKQSSSFGESCQFVPGSTISGAIANFWKQNGLMPSSLLFQKTFVQDDPEKKHRLHFSHLFPTNSENTSRFVPKTCLACRQNCGVYDFLILELIQTIACQQNIYLPFLPKCPKCKGDLLLAVTRLYSPDLKHVWNIPHRLVTRLPNNPTTGTAYPEGLHTIETIVPAEENIQYIGTLSNIIPEISEWVKKLHMATIFLGGGRSRGFGKAQILLNYDLLQENNILERILGFNNSLQKTIEKLVECWAPLKQLVSFFQKPFFCVTCLSELSLPSEPSIPLPMPDFVNMLGIPAKLESAMFTVSSKGGWNSCMNSHREIVPVYSPGSVFIYSLPTQSILEQITPALEVLEYTGIGLQTESGLGKIKICDPLHTTYAVLP